MNRIILTLSLITIASASFAQVEPGIKVGGNIFDIGGDSNPTHTRVGLHAGAFAHIHMSDIFAIQPELVYSMQGARSKVGGPDRTIQLDYINVPVLFQLMFGNGFRVQAGPQVGFLVNAKMKAGDMSTGIKNNYNTIDFAFPVGASYITESGFGVDARYSIGLSNINEDDNVRRTNRGLQVGVFYQFVH